VRVRSLLRFSGGGGGIDAIFGEGRVFSGEQDVRVFLGVAGEAKAAAALGNKRSRPLPRPGGVLLGRRRWGRRVVYRSPWPVSSPRWQVGSLLAFLSKGAGLAAGAVVAWWLDLLLSFLGGGGRRWRWQIQELLGSGARPRSTCDSRWLLLLRLQSKPSAMGSLQLTVVFGFFFVVDGRRRGCRLKRVHEGSRDLLVFSFFLKVLCDVWMVQLSLYPFRTALYLYVFLI